MSFDKVFDFVVETVRRQERDKHRAEDNPNNAVAPAQFVVDRRAGDLVEPAKKRAAHHRERELHYVTHLEEAEKELREKGVTVDVFDAATGTYMSATNTISSGSIGAPTQQFQPRVDPKLLDNVKNAKAKLLAHREKAEQYEKYARAYACAPTT